MGTFTKLISASMLGALLAFPAIADVCDYRPSQLIGGGGAGAVAGGSAATAATGVGLKAAGFYTLVHASSGLTMLGSTAVGASAAGTVGIIGGSAGVAGTVGAVLMAPVTIIVAAGVGLGVGAYEGACWFGDERITDPDQIATILRNMGENADPRYFRFIENRHTSRGPFIRMPNDKGEQTTYFVNNLYIVNGVLKHRDWGPNTTIGRIDFVVTSTDGGK